MTTPDPSAGGSRRPGWHALSVSQRQADVARWLDRPVADLRQTLEGGLSQSLAARFSENVIGRLALPLSVAPNFVIDGVDRLVPMATEEPSVVAAASHGALVARRAGGFATEVDPPLVAGQILLRVDDPLRCAARVEQAAPALLAVAREHGASMVARGGGPRSLHVRTLSSSPGAAGLIVVDLLVDVRDAMGANAVNALAEALAPVVAARAGGAAVAAILSNLCDERRVRVRLELPEGALGRSPEHDAQACAAVETLSRWAQLDPYRAATHNKGIFNGIDAVLLATGNDWRAVEAGAHAFAARHGSYGPLCRWHVPPSGGLVGELELPLAVGVVGGATTAHPTARLALEILGATGAAPLAAAAACAGMACNLSALRALGGEGIQCGHMRLHRRRG